VNSAAVGGRTGSAARIRRLATAKGPTEEAALRLAAELGGARFGQPAEVAAVVDQKF
jgi:hypothetical protein